MKAPSEEIYSNQRCRGRITYRLHDMIASRIEVENRHFRIYWIPIVDPLINTFIGLQLCRWQIWVNRLAVVASQICECEIMRSSEKIRTYSSSMSSKVISLGVSRKLTCDFLLLINSNLEPICYRFRDIDAES